MNAKVGHADKKRSGHSTSLAMQTWRKSVAHACSLDLEGIVSKRKDSRYVSGRSPYWLKMKNSANEAVRREAEEEWGQ